MSEKILNQILEEMKAINQRMDKMDNRLKKMENTIATKEDIHRIENIIEKSQIENINSDNLILQKQDEIKNTVNSIEDRTKSIQTTQDKQERTLDILSRRSIEQEAELRRIK